MQQKRVALFVNNLDEEYQISIFKAVREEAYRLNYQVVCIQSEPIFSGREETTPFYSEPWLKVDGVLFLSSVIGRELSDKETAYIKQLFASVPCVSIGKGFSNFPAILTESTAAFSNLIKHLVEDHGYRKLLYIGGPAQHHDNIIRENILLNIADKYTAQGKPLEIAIEHGLFHEYSSMVITQKYIQTYPADPFDAIIAANDNMAIGAIKAIETSENPLWQQCAITGFDDIPLASLEYPPITTIHQPLDELGKGALKLLHSFIEKQPNAADKETVNFVESTLVIRESCGCKASNHLHGSNLPKSNVELRPFTAIPPNLKHHLQHSFIEGDSASYLYLSVKSEQNMRNLSYLGQRLITVNTYQGMVQHLSDFLANLSVSLCYLFVFPEPLKGSGGEAMLVYRKGSDQEYFEAGNHSIVSIDEVLKKEQSTVQCVYPLRSGEKYVGILVYNSYDYAQPHMCSCATFLANNIQRLHEVELEKKRAQILEEQVQMRTQELVSAYKELQEESRRREAVEAEVLRISELERLRFSLDLHDDICQRLAGLSMYCKSMLSRDPDLGEVIQMIDETLMLTRRYAHDAFPVELENLGLEKALENLCTNIERQMRTSCYLWWQVPEDFPRLTKNQEINLYRIVQEAVNNSLKHGKATELTISVTGKDRQTYTITVQDNGKGSELINQFPANMTIGGVGLRSMQYRTHQMQGTLHIHSSVTEGTSISITIPVEKAEQIERSALA